MYHRKSLHQSIEDIYADADQTELMKMAVRMPDAMKIERDEIDENDWAQIKVVIEEGLNNIMTFRKRRGVSLEKEFQLRIGNIRQYMNFSIGLGTCKSYKRSHKAIDELKVNVDENRFEQVNLLFRN
jgi:uncharacterized protein YicC (UPF0701 family)